MKGRMLALSLGLVCAIVVTRVPSGLGQEIEKDRVHLKVLVPQADATLVIEGKNTNQTGKVRTFKSPPLKDPQGRYTYTLKVTWEPNNYTKITRTKILKVEPGKEIEVDLRKKNPEGEPKDDIVVRFVPTPNEVVDAMCRLAKIGKDDVVYDLGCGDGRMVIMAVEKFGAKKGIGIDIDPKLVKQCKEAAKNTKVEDKLEFREGDVLKIDDIPNATVVLLYMGDDINNRLKPILKAKLKPGARVVSHRFLMGDDWPTAKTETISHEGDNYDIHLWVIGEDKGDKEK